MRPRKERQVGAWPSFGVRVEQVIGAGIVLIDALLDEAHAEHARIEVEIFLRRARYGGDVMKTVHAIHAEIIAHDESLMPDR